MKFYTLWRGVLAVTFCLMMTACAGLESLTPPPPRLYTLTPKSTFPEAMPTVDWQLVVEQPLVAEFLSLRRIVAKRDALRIDYFQGAAWADRTPNMIQALLVESFENSGRIISVGRQVVGLRSDYNLKLDVREFQAEYTTLEMPPIVRVRINAKLVQQPRRTIIAAKNFEVVVAAKVNKIDAVVLAFDDALGKVLKSIVIWTLTTPKSPAK